MNYKNLRNLLGFTGLLSGCGMAAYHYTKHYYGWGVYPEAIVFFVLGLICFFAGTVDKEAIEDTQALIDEESEFQ